MLDLNTVNRLRRQGWKPKTELSLTQMKKKNLIEMIRFLENNWATALERCDNQYKLLTDTLELDEDGTLLVKVGSGKGIERVFVSGADHWGGLYYLDTDPDEDEKTYGSRTGSWQEVETSLDNTIASMTEAKCSCCGKYSTQPSSCGYITYKYCPRCGAKMEEE